MPDLCCPAWQLVDCVDCASAFDICEIKNYFTLLLSSDSGHTEVFLTVGIHIVLHR